MKIRSLFISLSVVTVCLCSCQNQQKKAEKLAQNYIQDILYVPESYEAISTKFDSAFYNPVLDELILEKAKEILKAEEKVSESEIKLERIEKDIRSAKSSMAIWTGSSSAYSKNQYQDAKEDYEKALKQQSETETVIQEARQSISDGESFILNRVENDNRFGQFIGWEIEHRYRAETLGGLNTIGNIVLVVTPSMTDIMYAIDEDDQEQTVLLNRIMEIFEE